MMRKLHFTLKIVSLSLLFALQNMAIVAGYGSDDPFSKIQYKKAFDQATIYEKYRTLLEKMGCADNVFQSNAGADSISRQAIASDKSAVNIKNDPSEVVSFDPVSDAKEFAAFKRECLMRLNNARRLSILIPTTVNLSDLAFTGVVGASVHKILQYFPNAFGTDNIGNVSLSALFGALYSMKGIVGAGYNLMYWPQNSLEALENHYAKNKCYIPNALWPKIELQFLEARQSLPKNEAQKHFLEFATGFTVYKPKPALKFKDDMSIEDVKNELSRRIDEFFGNYKNNPQLNYIKINVSKFIDLLAHDPKSARVQPPRYLYLYGSGGIGKTHFVQTLENWINELVPQSVSFDDVIINSYDDLEGSEARPGAFLKALRNQLMQNRRGSVIMMDEATWLNDPGMVSSAKRIFNGDQAKLVTSYFGKNMDGTGVSLEIPPMLIFVASNEKIVDPALESRFDIILYPAPSQEALIMHAINVAEKSSVLKQANCPVNPGLIVKWVQSFDERSRNFRFVAGNVEALLLAHNK